MRFKDVNCGYFFTRRTGQYAGTFDEVKDICGRNEITARAVQNFDYNGASVRAANQDILNHCSGTGDIPVLRLLPPSYGFESYTKNELLELIEKHRAAFKINPQQDVSPVTGWMFDWMLDLLSEYSVPLLISLQEADLRDLAAVKQSYPALKIIITNTTQWMNRQYIRFVLAFPNVFLDTSNIIEYYGLENIAGIIGAERILFGTYMPEKEPYDKIFQMLHNDLSPEQCELIAWGNFERVIERRD